MATIGQQLLQPESGWKRYDDRDPRLIYVGANWATFDTGTKYNGTSISPFNGVEELHLAEAMNHASTRDIFIQVKPESGRGIPQTTIDIIVIAAIVKS